MTGDNLSRSDMKRMQSELFEHHQRLLLAARVGGLGIWDYDVVNDAMTCDQQWYKIVGRDPARPIRCVAEFRAVIHPEDCDRATEVEQTARNLISQHADYGIVFRIVRPDGEIRWVRSSACIFDNEAGEPVRAVGYVVDITDSWIAEQSLKANVVLLRQENESLARQAFVDPLTGIANRRRLDQELERACLHAARTGESLSVALIDVDFFKLYNDRYGHARGDAALAAVAEAIASATWRPYDLAARYGGEEFAVILPGPAPETVIERIFANIAAMALPHETSSVSQFVTISCGCVTSSDPSKLTPVFMLSASDAALYEAKRYGRNRFQLASA